MLRLHYRFVFNWLVCNLVLSSKFTSFGTTIRFSWKLKWSSGVMMTWSSGFMQSIWPAKTNCSVIVMSFLLGLGSPEGWLWATIILTARSSKATAKISRGWTFTLSTVPMNSTCLLIICRLTLSVNTIKCSCLWSAMSLRWHNKSFGLLIRPLLLFGITATTGVSLLLYTIHEFRN